MDEQRTDNGAHALQGPHLELRGDAHSSFVPLKLLVQPGKLPVTVSRTSAILGRHSRADIRLAFPEISRRHCRVTYANRQWHITDLDSLNGVWINGERMHEAVLYDGDCVRIGGCVLMVLQGTPLAAVKKKRKTDPQLRVIKDIAEALPRKAG